MITCLGCDWWFASWSMLQALTSAPPPPPHPPTGPSVTQKSLWSHSCVHFPALPGIWLEEMGVEIVIATYTASVWKTGWDDDKQAKAFYICFIFYLPKEIMNAPRRCRWRSGSGCGSSTARSALDSAAGSAAQIVVPWKKYNMLPVQQCVTKFMLKCVIIQGLIITIAQFFIFYVWFLTVPVCPLSAYLSLA